MEGIDVAINGDKIVKFVSWRRQMGLLMAIGDVNVDENTSLSEIFDLISSGSATTVEIDESAQPSAGSMVSFRIMTVPDGDLGIRVAPRSLKDDLFSSCHGLVIVSIDSSSPLIDAIEIGNCIVCINKVPLFQLSLAASLDIFTSSKSREIIIHKPSCVVEMASFSAAKDISIAPIIYKSCDNDCQIQSPWISFSRNISRRFSRNEAI